MASREFRDSSSPEWRCPHPSFRKPGSPSSATPRRSAGALLPSVPLAGPCVRRLRGAPPRRDQVIVSQDQQEDRRPDAEEPPEQGGAHGRPPSRVPLLLTTHDHLLMRFKKPRRTTSIPSHLPDRKLHRYCRVPLGFRRSASSGRENLQERLRGWATRAAPSPIRLALSLPSRRDGRDVKDLAARRH